MLAKYLDILRLPGAWRFSLAGFVLRGQMSMIGIAILLLVRDVWGNYTLAGAVNAANIIGVSVCAPLLARLVDRLGQRRVMAPAQVINVLATLVLTLAALWHAPIVLVAAAAAIAGASQGSPGALVRSRWAVVVENPGQLQTAYAFEAAMDEVIFIVGPIIVTLLATMVDPLVPMGLILVCTVVGALAFFSQTSTEPPLVDRTATTGSSRSPMLNPVVIGIALVYVGAGAMFGANDVSVVASTAEHGRPELSGLLLAVFAFGSLVAALVHGAITWRAPVWRLYATGVLALAAGASTFLFARNLWVLAVALVLTGLTIAPTMTNVNTIISKVVPPHQLTEGLTWMSTAMNLGVSVGSAVSGPVVDSSGAHAGFLVVIVCAWSMVLVMALTLPRLRRALGSPQPPTVPPPAEPV